MTEAELLSKVKAGLGITGNYQDETIQIFINEVKAFMVSAGVTQEKSDSEASVGVIIRGVADLWNLESGTILFSTYFKMRVIQLAAQSIPPESI